MLIYMGKEKGREKMVRGIVADNSSFSVDDSEFNGMDESIVLENGSKAKISRIQINLEKRRLITLIGIIEGVIIAILSFYITKIL